MERLRLWEASELYLSGSRSSYRLLLAEGDGGALPRPSSDSLVNLDPLPPGRDEGLWPLTAVNPDGGWSESRCPGEADLLDLAEAAPFMVLPF